MNYSEAQDLFKTIPKVVTERLKNLLIRFDFWDEDSEEPYLTYDEYEKTPPSIFTILKHEIEKSRTETL